jgi:lysophospholipase L1-like esterase
MKILLFILLIPILSFAQTDTVDIMYIGDSITESGSQGSYHSFLYKYLSDSGKVFHYVGSHYGHLGDYDMSAFGWSLPNAYKWHEGVSGRQISVMLDSIRTFITRSHPDIIYVQGGTNDVYALYTLGACSQTTVNRMGALLDSIKAIDPTIWVIAGNPPPVFSGWLPGTYTPAFRDSVAATVALWPSMIASRINDGRHLDTLDVNTLMVDSTYCPGDGVHPGNTGNQAIGQNLYSHMVTAIDNWTTVRNFKHQVWYSSYDERPYASYLGFGVYPWLIDWTGVDVIVHFDNGNVNTNASPYWAYINQGNAFADSVHLFEGTNHNYAFVDSLTTIGHRNNAAVVMTIQAVVTDSMNYVMADSTRTETFCVAVAQWCERNDYDGVDLNYEGTATTRANMSRFIRRMRIALDANLTTFDASLKRAWFSITGPPQHFGAIGTGIWQSTDTTQVDMFNVEVGVSIWEFSFGGHIYSWFNIAVRNSTGGGSSAFAQANSENLETLSDDSPWYAGTPTGIRRPVYYGFDKSHLSPAFELGGMHVWTGIDSAGAEMPTPYTFAADVSRGRLQNLLANGGTWKWDSHYQAAYVSGTASAHITDPHVESGVKFYCPAADSQNTWYATTWLLQNGYGGIAPFSVTQDFDSSVAEGASWSDAWKRLPAHSGIVQAVLDFNGGTVEEDTTEPATSYSITSTTLAGGTVGVAYSQQIVFTSPVTADVRVYIRGLPDGLWVNYLGLIQGVPTKAGTFTATYELRQRFSRTRQTTGAISITIGS